MNELPGNAVSEDVPVVAHIVASDTAWCERQMLEQLLAGGIPPFRQILLSCTTRSSPQLGTSPVRRVHAPSRLPVLRTLALRRQLAEIVLETGARRMILHAWSPRAARWCAPLVDDAHRLVVETPERCPSGAVVWPTSGRLRHMPAYACPSARALSELGRAGVPSWACTVMPRTLPWRFPARDRVATLRRSLKLATGDRVVVVLPPHSRATGVMEAAWACILVRQVAPSLRVVVARGSDESLRTERLLDSVRHAEMGCFAPSDTTLGELVALADVAVFIPRASDVAPAIPAALASGATVVTTVPALPADESVLRCAPGSVRDAARAILKALDRKAGAERIQHSAKQLESPPPGFIERAYAELYSQLIHSGRIDHTSRTAPRPDAADSAGADHQAAAGAYPSVRD